MRENLEYRLDEPLADFWRRRLDYHTHDHYRGRVLAKMPEDLRVYQHLIESSQPEVIVEIGTFKGGSATWFADQLVALAGAIPDHPLVYTIDIEVWEKVTDPRVRFIHGDIKDPLVWGRIREEVGGRRVMVSEDGHHSHESTLAALRAFADLVPCGQWFVVEDGIVDHQELKLPRYKGGVDAAIKEFLASNEGRRFSRHYLQPYGITTCWGGWLRADR